MKTFFNILHKQTAKSNELYGVSIDDANELYRMLFTEELKCLEKNITPIHQTHIISTKLLIYMFIVNSVDHNVINYKYNYIRKMDKNTFFRQEIKDMFFDAFCLAQNTYNVVNRLVYRWKFRRMKPCNTADLFMNEINENQCNVISLVQEDRKYIFTVTDIINIVENCLCNMLANLAASTVSKNPYNNVPFTKANLYNIYFFLHGKYLSVPPLIREYFNSGFNLINFQNSCEILIREEYVNRFMKNASDTLLYNHFKNMLNRAGYYNKIKVHSEFPRKRLLEIMRPYLKIYIQIIFSYSDYHSNMYMTNLKNELSRLHTYNPIFGRKMYDMKTNEPYFPDEHPKVGGYFRDFEKSHLTALDDEDDHDDRDDNNDY